ncbi:MAG: mechanosensitive ion channel domain-containing protein, partial [Planctomycetota bacterium]
MDGRPGEGRTGCGARARRTPLAAGIRAAGLVALALLAWAPSAAAKQGAAQDDAQAATAEPGQRIAALLTRLDERTVDLRTRLEAMSQETDLAEAALATITEEYTKGLAFLAEAREEVGRAEQLVTQGAVAPSEDELKEVPKAGASIDELQEAREVLTPEVETIETRLDEVRRLTDTRDARRASLAADLSAARAALSGLRDGPVDPEEGVDPRVAAAQRARRDAERAALEARVEAMIAQNDAFARGGSALEEARRTLEARLVEARGRLDVVQSRLVENSLYAARTALNAARTTAASAPASLAPIAAENVTLAEGLLARAREQESLLAGTRAAEEAATTLARRLTALQDRAEKANSTQQIGGLLRKERNRLADARALQRRANRAFEERSERDLEALDLEERLRALERGEPDPGASDEERAASEALAARLLALRDEDGADGPGLSTEERQALVAERELSTLLLATRVRLLGQRESTARAVAQELGAKLQALNEQLETTRDLTEFVEERVLWVRSTEPAWSLDLSGSRRSVQRYFAWERVRALPGHFGEALASAPLRALGLLTLAWFLFWTRRQLGDRIDARLGPDAPLEQRRRVALSIAPTVEQLARSAAGAVLLPLVVAAFVLCVRGHAFDPALPIARSLATGVAEVLPAWFVLSLLRRIARPSGLGEGPLQWGPQNMRLVRTNLRWFMPLYLVLAAAIGTVHASEDQALVDSVGRALFLGKVASFGAFVAVLLRSGGLEPITARPSIVAQLRRLWLFLGVGSMAALFVGSLLGYHYTARNLWAPLEATVGLLAGLTLVRAVVARWILVNRRRLRVEQARERRAKAEAEAAAGTDPVVAERTAREVEEEEGLDLGSLEVEVGELLRFATGAAALLGVAAIWRNFFPALAALREVWEVKDAAGTSVFSLYSLGTAVLAAALTWVLAKRLPGLLEFTVLNRFKLGRGERYAIRAVVTYVLTAVGTLVTLGLLGVRWANVQWLAAAVSVGLGFGLQEIFANFVSGLILLFERPIRVGDLVTVAGIEGRVTEIRIRATTILDYDRREMVVPNREFVTGSLVNWTLSDPITRLVVNVGIAYGSDVETARELMKR